MNKKKKAVVAVAQRVVSVKTMKMVKWGSIMAGVTALIVGFILKENHMVTSAISAGIYEGSKLAQEFLEPIIRTLENLTEGAEDVAEMASEVVEAIEA